MLDTNLKHINTAKELEETIRANENVMVCCGRMGPMCIPVYGVMEELEGQYAHVAFRDMPFDSPEAQIIRRHSRSARTSEAFPLRSITRMEKWRQPTSIQTKEQVTAILDKEFV